MNRLKLIVTKRQQVFVALFLGIAIGSTFVWINNNSGLRPGNGAQIELARLLAKACVVISVSLIYTSIAFYACHRWNKFRGQVPSDETTGT